MGPEFDLSTHVMSAFFFLPPPPGRPPVHHALGPNVVMKVVKMKASFFFFAVNAGELDVIVKLEVKGDGYRVVMGPGGNGEVHVGKETEKFFLGVVANGGDTLSLHYEFMCDVKLGGGGGEGGGEKGGIYERRITRMGIDVCRKIASPEVTPFGVGQGNFLEVVGARGGV